MKHVKYLLPLLLLAITLFASCYPRDICKGTNCQNGGVCTEYSCICPTGYNGKFCEYKGCPIGYEGAGCKMESRFKFVGSWAAFEDGSISLPSQYAASIEPKTVNGVGDPVYVSILNFHNFSKSVLAYVAGDTIFVPKQENGDKRVIGRGQIKTTTAHGEYGSIEMRYQVIDIATGQIDDYGYDTVKFPGSKFSEWIK